MTDKHPALIPQAPSGKLHCGKCLKPILLKGDTTFFRGANPIRCYHFFCAIKLAFKTGKPS